MVWCSRSVNKQERKQEEKEMTTIEVNVRESAEELVRKVEEKKTQTGGQKAMSSEEKPGVREMPKHLLYHPERRRIHTIGVYKFNFEGARE
jgi:hypothetical protein